MNNLFKKLFTGAAIVSAPYLSSAEKPAEKPVNLEPTKTEAFSEKTTLENNAEVVNFAAEREAHIKQIEQKMHKLEEALLKKDKELHLAQASLQHTYEKAVEYSGVKQKHKLHGIEYKLSELAKQMGREQIVSHEITSDEAVDMLLGKLLAMDGPLKEFTEQITSISGNQLGSTVMISTDRPGKYESEDMNIHKHLGTDPKEIVKKSLEIVDIQNQLKQYQGELENILGIPPAQGTVAQTEIPSVSF